jgi:hypothetical protein
MATSRRRRGILRPTTAASTMRWRARTDLGDVDAIARILT